MGCLYKLTSPSNKSYIGISSKTLEARWAKHVEHALGKRDAGALYAALRKYGPDNFKKEILAEENDWKRLCEMEIDAIKTHNTRSPNGYNITLGGEGTLGPISDEARKRVSVAQKKRFSNPVERERMRILTQAGMTPEKRAASHQKRIQTMRTPEFRARASETSKLQFQDPEQRRIQSEKSKEMWARPGFRKAVSDRMKEVMANPERRRAISEAVKISMRSPETAMKVKLEAQRRAADPTWRAKIGDSKRGKPNPKSPEWCKKISEIRKAEWSDPIMRAKRLAGAKRRWAAQKAQAHQMTLSDRRRHIPHTLAT